MIKQRLVSNFENIFRAKVHFFMKKSIWKYLILTLILGYLKPINGLNPLITAVIYFAGINAILWPLQYVSAKSFAKKINFDALVEFSETEIKINHGNKDLVELKDWSWIKNIELNKKHIWLTLNQTPPFGISIPKSNLNASEIALFENMRNRKQNS
ncbi:hypothetical protein ACFFU1_10025 [Algibacter miyuki]|uniref:YcxB-like protein domain-containing protein n=1 Tax=Algibacter miyuki TaxID=1306933 RepID=A0ABV5H019_9FLAO|nr:hypothetical protein [Algibacter miyuki]MDN3667518.1 hypothetical protein [Algibacter miyuki]